MSGTGLGKNGPGKNGSRIIGLVVRVGKNGPFIKECGDKNGPIGIYVKLKKQESQLWLTGRATPRMLQKH